MAHCVNRSSKEFKALAEQSNINPIVLAAKVSLWQESNGLDNFPTLEQIETKEKEDYALPLSSSITEDSDFSEEEFTAFKDSYHSKEELKAAAESINQGLTDAVGYVSKSYITSKNSAGFIDKVVVTPVDNNDSVTAVNNTTFNVATRMSKIAHPSFIRGFISIVGQVENKYRNTIRVKYNNEVLQAFAEGMETSPLEQFQQYMYLRFLESKGIYKSQIQTGQDAREELEFLKTLPHSEFQGFYNPDTGEVFRDLSQWKAYLNEIISYDEMMDQQEDEDNALIINNPTSSIYIDPTYEYYKVKRKSQISNLEKTIHKLRSKERLEGTDSALTDKISYLDNIKTGLEQDILDIEAATPSNYFNAIEKLLYKDINLIKELISNPSIENFFLAEDVSEFIKLNLDFSNVNSQLFKTDGDKTFEPKLDELIKEVSHLNKNLEGEINRKRNKHFIEILSKYENNIKKLYPGKTLEQIKDILLSNLEDITSSESLFLSEGKNLFSEADIVGELIRLEYDIAVEKEKPRVQRLIKKINSFIPRVEAELERLGHVTTVGKGVEGVSKFSFYNYQSLFYRKDDKGNILPTLVSKFSQKWDTFINNFNYDISNKLKVARYEKDWIKVDALLKEKFYKLNANVDFVDFRKLEDVKLLVANPTLDPMFSTNSAENLNYKNELINKIGLPEYNNIVKKQISHLQNYLSKEKYLISIAVSKEGVQTYQELSDYAKENINASLKRYNPAAFLEAQENKRQGLIEFTIGTQTNEKYSYLDYNTYIPKKDNFQNNSTKFYDKDYESIESNSVLKEFWPVLEETLYQINDALIDSDLRLDSKTILHMSKGLIEGSIDKGLYETAKGIPSKETVLNTVQHLKDTFSVKQKIRGKEQEVKLPNSINSFKNIIEEDYYFTRIQISNILGATLTNDTSVDWTKLSNKAKTEIYEALGINNEQEFLDQVELNAKGEFKVKSLKVFNSIAAMEQQTADLPMMLKALLEQSALHKARVASKETIDILRGVSEKIKDREGKNTEELDINQEKTGRVRTNAQKRHDYFYNSTVLSKSADKAGGNLSKVFSKGRYEKKYINGELIDPEDMFKYLLNVHHKNFSPQEKIQYAVMKKRWDFIQSKLDSPSTSVELNEALSKEKKQIEQRVTLMGKDYMASTLVSNLFNKGLAIGIGLGYSTLGMVYNYLNARSNFFHRDGEFWSEGNSYPAFAFVDMHATRHINPAYAKEWKVMEAFVHQLDLVQDGTNELQKAKKTGVTESPKIYNLKRWAQNPLYGTELVEWYNQIPVMLAMGADVEIINPTTGEKVPLFNGTGFPAHEVDENTGQLRLKSQFRSEENIKDYENFDSLKMNLWKVQVNRAIQSLNGDYSVSGVLRAKGSVAGQTMMLFKTWAGEYYHSRWAIDQKSVVFGKSKDGFISGSLMDKRTKGMAVSMLTANLGASILMTPLATYGLPLAIAAGAGGLALTAGIAGAMYYKKRKEIAARMSQQNVPSQLATKEMAMYMLKATTIGTLEMPINKAWNIIRLIAGSYTGKVPGPQTLFNIDSTFNNKLDEKAATNLRNLTRMFQKSNTSVLIAVLAQLFLGDDEDEETEPRGEDGSKQRKRYLEQQERRERKKFLFNTIKNINQREYDEMNLGHNLVGSINMFVGDQSTNLSSGEGTGKFFGQLFINPSERYSKPGSLYDGDYKLAVAARKAFLPQMFRNIGKEEWMLGFEIVGDQEYQRTDAIDRIFETDYKQDKKENTRVRSQIKLETEDKLSQRRFKKSYNSLTPKQRLLIDERVKEALKDNEEYRMIDRERYDKNQKKK